MVTTGHTMHPDCKEFMNEMLRVLKQERDHGRLRLFNMSCAIHVNACGTTACAIGTAAMDPWFRRRGLGFRYEDAEARPLPNGSGLAYAQQVMYDGEAVAFNFGNSALHRDFSIPSEDFAMLFGGDYATARRAYRRTTIGEVIEALERYIETGEIPN